MLPKKILKLRGSEMQFYPRKIIIVSSKINFGKGQNAKGIKAGTHKGACSWNTLPGKYPNQDTQRTPQWSWMMKLPDWGMGMKKISNLIGQLETPHFTANKFQYTPGSLLLNRLVQQICLWSLLPHIKPVWYEGAKVLLLNIFFP